MITKKKILVQFGVSLAILAVASFHVALQAEGITHFPGKKSKWNGFDRYDFSVDGRDCIVVTPKTSMPGKPWIWRTEYFGHEPQADLALLARGFHVGHINVRRMGGTPACVKHMDAFYNELTVKYGLSRKVALEGFSLGGLLAFNWATAHPDQVACMYGDAPVCNISHRPGRKDKGAGDRLNPIDNLAPLAKAGIPLLHVVGDADKTVPVSENTAIVEQRYKALGGNIKIIVKKGVDHHPHSLKDPAPIVEFILENTKMISANPVFRAETRIDDFNGRASCAPWTLSNGPEFPGASGGLQIVPDGHAGSAARLYFNLSPGSRYVAANLTLPRPLAMTRVSFWIRSPPGVNLAFSVQDSTGQVLHYKNLVRPIYALASGQQWFRMLIDLTTPSTPAGSTLKGKVRTISIIVEPYRSGSGSRIESGVAGHVDIDDIVDPGTADGTIDPAGAVIALPVAGADAKDFTRGSGIAMHGYFTLNQKEKDSLLTAIKSAGFTWVRIDLSWAGIEKKENKYGFKPYDDLIDDLGKHDLKALFILAYGNAIYSGKDSNHKTLPPTTPAARAAFAAYAKACAKHFAGHGACYEIWNEENHKNTWPGEDVTQNATLYAALCKQAIAAVKAGDPSALVTTGGLAGMGWDYLRRFLATPDGKAVVRTGKAKADAISVHPYRQDSPENNTDGLLLVRTLVPVDGPVIWSSEWGYSSTWYRDKDGSSPAIRDIQARYASRAALSAWLMGFPMRIFYEIRDGGTDPTNAEHNFGLLARDFTPKPAMDALVTLAAQMQNHRLVGMYPITVPDLLAIKLLGPNDIRVVVWRKGTGAPAAVRFPQRPEAVVDERGAAVAWTDLGGGAVSIPVGTSLVYATFPRSPTPPTRRARALGWYSSSVNATAAPIRTGKSMSVML